MPCHQHLHQEWQEPLEELIYLYAGVSPPASSPGTCALPVPILAVSLLLRSLPGCPALCSCPLPPAQLCTPLPAHLRERTHPTPLPLPQNMHL